MPRSPITLETTCRINAPPSVVWSCLVDFAGMKNWTAIIRLTGRRARAGAWSLLMLRLDGLAPIALPVHVTRADPERELRWRGGLPGLLMGEHFFRLEADGAQATTLIHGEFFTGSLAPLVLRLGLRSLSLRAYAAINAALKTCAETHPSGP